MKTSLGECSRWLLRDTLRGAWAATLRVSGDAGQITVGSPIVIADAWAGAVMSSFDVAGDSELEIVGGKGKLAALTQAKQYLGGAPAGTIAADLCASAGEVAAGDETALVGAWRARGDSLETELARLSPDWFIAPDGKVRLVRGAPPDGSVIGGRVRTNGDAATCQIDGVPPLVGAQFNGATIETALYRGGGGCNPRVTLWPLRARATQSASILAGTISSLAAGRCSINLDNGEELSDIPLFCAAGFVPEGATQVRVLVLDVGDDGANTIAITGVDGRIDALTLANAENAGTLLRANDKISITGLIAPPGGGAVTSTPGATLVQLDPTVAGQVGPPGLGHSQVKG